MKIKKSTNRLSPYIRYNKSPFVYSYKGCKHRESIIQSVPLWTGRVCTMCNTITYHKEKESNYFVPENRSSP